MGILTLHTCQVKKKKNVVQNMTTGVQEKVKHKNICHIMFRF